MKSIVDYTNKLKEFFASKQALANETVTRSKVGAHNLLQASISDIKSNNTTGTWSGNVYTVNNVSFTVNSDLSITVSTSGAASANSAIKWYFDLVSGNYILTSGVNGTSYTTKYLALYKEGVIDIADYNDGRAFTLASDTTQIRALIYINSGTTLNNVTFYPMIRLASDPNIEFEPYAMTNRELTKPITALQFKTKNATTASGSYKISNGYHRVIAAFAIGYIVQPYYSSVDGGSTWVMFINPDTLQVSTNVSTTLNYIDLDS